MATYDFARQVVLVTGGTRGIGRAIVEQFLASGASVVLTGHDNSTADVACRELAGAGFDGRVFGFGFEVTDPSGVAALVAEVDERVGPVNVLVNNAAVRPSLVPASLMTDAELVRHFRAAVSTPYELGRLLVAAGESTPLTAIVNISTAVAVDGASYLSAYAAAKAAMANMTKSMAKEWAKLGVRVNSVTPGPIATGFLEELEQRAPGFVERASTSTLLGRLGTPEEVAAAVLFLADTGASYITGADLVVGGGLLR